MTVLIGQRLCEIMANVAHASAEHLTGLRLPALALPSTSGRLVDLSALAARTVVYCYPRIAGPAGDVPAGWDLIPGARGCTPQSCAFRDHYQELRALAAEVFGLSTQSTAEQREAAQRLHLPFELLSDPALALATPLRLPVFTLEGATFLQRLTFIADAGRIVKVFYPVPEPAPNAARVIAWLAGSYA